MTNIIFIPYFLLFIWIWHSLFTKVISPWNMYLHNIQNYLFTYYILHVMRGQVISIENNEPQNFVFGTFFSPPDVISSCSYGVMSKNPDVGFLFLLLFFLTLFFIFLLNYKIPEVRAYTLEFTKHVLVLLLKYIFM